MSRWHQVIALLSDRSPFGSSVCGRAAVCLIPVGVAGVAAVVVGWSVDDAMESDTAYGNFDIILGPFIAHSRLHPPQKKNCPCAVVS